MKNLLSLALIILVFSASAQDYLTKTSGEQLTVKILEVGSKSVLYKPYDNQNGPVYRISVNEINKITFENGTVQTFNKQSTSTGIGDHMAEDRSSILTLDILGLMAAELSLSYEQIVADGYLGLKVPFIMRLDHERNYGRRVKSKLLSGFQLNFYPDQQGRVSYFVGPSILFGQSTVRRFSFITNEPTYQDVTATYVELNNGLMIRPSDAFTMSWQVGIGYRTLRNTSLREDETWLGPNYFSLRMSLGYRF